VLNAFVDSTMADLSRAELAAWLCLYRDTRPNGEARASFDDIARRAGIDRRSVARALGKLKARKMLRVVRRGGRDRGPSTYRVFPYPME
jgi:CRP-like cAMP-binding protein